MSSFQVHSLCLTINRRQVQAKAAPSVHTTRDGRLFPPSDPCKQVVNRYLQRFLGISTVLRGDFHTGYACLFSKCLGKSTRQCYLFPMSSKHMERSTTVHDEASGILARLVPSVPEGRARVKFVTEGEASLHCCLHKRILESVSPTE